MHTNRASTTTDRPARTRRWVRAILAPVALMPMLAVAGGGTAVADESPGFSMRIISFHAIDETGADWSGSDEVYFKTWDHSLNSYGSGHTKSGVYRGVDTGESRTVNPSHNCVTATQAVDDKDGNGNLNGSKGETWTCKTGGPAFGRMDATIKLYDEETFGDELIGTRHMVREAHQLAALMPVIGATHDLTETFDRSGRYRVVFRVERVR